MLLIKRNILILLLNSVLCFASAYAQKVDSVSWARNRTIFFYDGNYSFNMPDFNKIDTILKGVEQYNPAFNRNYFTEWTGNIGRPVKSMIYEPNFSIGFDLGIHTFDYLLFNNFSQAYYQVRKPFTSLTYISGPEKEDVLQVIHTQNITKTLNIGLKYRVIDSWGTYQYISSDDRQLIINSNYISPSGKYRYLAAYYHNSIDIQESGGISSDSVFENQITNQSLSIPVNLNSANNVWKETGWFVKQIYNFKTINKDTNVLKTFNPGAISLSLHYYRNSQLYTDKNEGKNAFFSNIYFDSTLTHDSLFIHWFETDFSWTNSIKDNFNNQQHLNLIFGIKQRYIELKDTIRNFHFNQFTPYAGLTVFAFGKFLLRLNGEMVLGDYNGGDLILKGLASFDFLKKEPGKIKLETGLIYSQKNAEWLYEWQYSNYFRWNNDFDIQNFISYFGNFNYKSFKVNLSLHQLNNLVYLNNNLTPDWHDKMIHVLSLKVKKDINFKFIEIENDFIYQYTPDKAIINLPEIIAMHSWYFNLKLFKKYLYLQPGFSLFYNSGYYADNYMPALRVFYKQDVKSIGNYIYADLFVNMQIKRANLFFKYQHVNSGLNGFNYYMSPHYPQQPSALKFGITWNFYD